MDASSAGRRVAPSRPLGRQNASLGIRLNGSAAYHPGGSARRRFGYPEIGGGDPQERGAPLNENSTRRGRRCDGCRFSRSAFWEEERKPTPDHKGLGGGRPLRTVFPLAGDRLAGDVRDVRTRDTEIVQLAVRKAAKLVAGFPVAAPVAIRTKDIHFDSPYCRILLIASLRSMTGI